MNKRPVVIEEEKFKQETRDMLDRRHFKDVVARLVWLRSQKQLAVDANLRRAETAQREMSWLEDMVDEEESKGEVSTDGT